MSTTTGGSVAGVVLDTYRVLGGEHFSDRRFRILRGQLYGTVHGSTDEAHRLALAYGYLQPYGRNTCRFVMSRAARRRGMTTTDGGYRDRQRWAGR